MSDGRIVGYHFLRNDMTAASGSEPPWTVGEERTYDGPITLCESGYHWSPSWYDALGYAQGNMACLVEVSPPVARDDAKGVSRSRKLLVAVNVAPELRLWACDCAERALLREREWGWEPDARSWQAIAVARGYAVGAATQDKLAAAWAASDAASDAVWAAEVAWQRQRLAEYLDAVVRLPEDERV